MSLVAKLDSNGRLIGLTDTGIGDLGGGEVAVTPEQAAALAQGMALVGGSIVSPTGPGPTGPAFTPTTTIRLAAAASTTAGLAVTSSGTPSISASYATVGPAFESMRVLYGYCNATGGFPASAATWTVLDVAGNPVVLPSPSALESIYLAILAYKAQYELYRIGASGSAPLATASIS